ncbi:hypothetical protein [Maricaulis sp.]|uniref:TolB family protein n=1 Tax=Maricaulis sp. TaxID=1486257 RepID=UPI0025B8B295|nr:hypothetical protein [Maricaulis sp.]
MRHLFRIGLLAAGLGLSVLFSEAMAQQSDFAPQVSPGGRWLVYYSYRNGASPDLFLIDVETGDERALTETADVWEIEPHWSWDGRYILFGAGAGMPDIRPAFLELERGRPAGPVRRFDSAPAGMRRVTAVEPGQSVLYVQEYGFPIRQRFSIYRPGDGATPWLDAMPEGEFAVPFLSPDGSFLIAVRELDGQTDIVRVDHSTGAVLALTDTLEAEAYLAWSAGGRWLTWSQADASGARQIFGLELDEGGHPVADARLLTRGEAGQVHFFSSVSDDNAWLYHDASTPQGFELRRRRFGDPDGPYETLTRRVPAGD